LELSIFRNINRTLNIANEKRFGFIFYLKKQVFSIKSSDLENIEAIGVNFISS
jgi:hypothetical protein